MEEHRHGGTQANQGIFGLQNRVDGLLLNFRVGALGRPGRCTLLSNIWRRHGRERALKRQPRGPARGKVGAVLAEGSLPKAPTLGANGIYFVGFHSISTGGGESVWAALFNSATGFRSSSRSSVKHILRGDRPEETPDGLRLQKLVRLE